MTCPDCQLELDPDAGGPCPSCGAKPAEPPWRGHLRFALAAVVGGGVVAAVLIGGYAAVTRAREAAQHTAHCREVCPDGVHKEFHRNPYVVGEKVNVLVSRSTGEVDGCPCRLEVYQQAAAR